MKRFIVALILLLAATAMAAEHPDDPRNNLITLRKNLQESDAAITSPEEFNSFSMTADAAEKLHEQGDNAAARQLFALTLLKGELMLKSNNKTPPPAVPEPSAEELHSLPANIDVTAEPDKPGVAVTDQLFSLEVLKWELLLTAGSKAPSSLASIYNQPARHGFTAFNRSLYLVPAQDPARPATSPPATAVTASAAAHVEKKISDRIVGGEGIYTVRSKDSLRLIASRLGVRLRDLARMNRLKTDAALMIGQKLKYNNRRIVPKSVRNGIVVNIPDRSLYLFRNGKVSASYPVALGIPKKKESTIWRTPVGKFQIIDKKENPTWRIPPSIQKEMEENGEEVIDIMPPGPKNPLGKFAMRTTLAGILIHSTTRPASINSYSSHGCIRVMPEHMEQLFKSVLVPMQGEIVYQPVKVEVTKDGRVFLEVNTDSYEQVADLSAEVRRVINKHQADGKVSWQMVNRLINEKSGIAEEVTLAASRIDY